MSPKKRIIKPFAHHKAEFATQKAMKTPGLKKEESKPIKGSKATIHTA